MAKTVVNLTDTFGQLVTKVNQISNDLGDIQGVHFYDSSAAGMLIAAKKSADSTNAIAVRSALSVGTPKNLDFDSATGQFNLLFDSAQAKKLISVSASGTGSLSYDNSSGEITYVGASTDLSADTTPQLGGDLDINGKRITVPDHSAGVNNRIVFGADSDLKIYHNASHSIIEDAGTGSLQLRTNSLAVQNASGSESQITGLSGGAVTLYHNNAAKLATSATGVTVTGKTATTTLSIGGVDVTSDAGELNILDGVTASATELNKLDGVTSSTAELNLLDLDTGEQVGVFKVEAISAGNPVIGDFTNNTKIIFQY